MQFNFLPKFLKAEQKNFINIDMGIISITLTKQTIFIHNFIFYEKPLTRFKKLTKKMIKIHPFLKNWYQI